MRRDRRWTRRGAPAVIASLAASLLAALVSAAPAAAFSGTAPAPLVTPFHTPSPPDPLIATGKGYVLTSETGDLEFWTKPTSSTLATPINFPGTSSHGMGTTHFFAKRIQAFNTSGLLPSAACGAASTLPELPAQYNPEGFGPRNVGCLLQSYDARIYYDAARGRWWIITAVRNLLWTCTAANGAPGLQTDPDEIPNQTTSTGATKCHTNWKQSWARRYLVVAVSKSSNPSQGFHRFLLNANDYQDWPQFTLHDHYLVVNHMDTPRYGPNVGHSFVFVFNADAIADASAVRDQKGTPFSPLAKFGYGKFGGATAPIYLVNQHGGRKALTYLWTPHGTQWTLYALYSSNPASATNVPTLIIVGSVTLNHNIGGSLDNAVSRVDSSGRTQIWYASDYCAQVGLQPTKKIPCAKWNMYLENFHVDDSAGIPTFLNVGVTHNRLISADAGTTTAKNASYEKPAVEITSTGDVVVLYERTGLLTAQVTGVASPPTAVRYLIWYAGKSGVSTGRSLQAGLSSPSTPDPNGAKASVDLGGVSLDPGGHIVWLNHAYANNTGGYSSIAGAVKP